MTSKPKTAANSFNDFFTSIADSIRTEIPPTYSHFSRFLRKHNHNSIFLSRNTPEEVTKVISSFSVSKSSGPNSIPTKILKLLKHDISTPISFLVNRSFTTGARTKYRYTVLKEISNLTLGVDSAKISSRLTVSAYITSLYRWFQHMTTSEE